jgi:hypothetical protein
MVKKEFRSSLLEPGSLSYLRNFPIDVRKIDRSFFGVFRLRVLCLRG